MQISKIVLWSKFSNKGVCTSYHSEKDSLFSFFIYNIFKSFPSAHNFRLMDLENQIFFLGGLAPR